MSIKKYNYCPGKKQGLRGFALIEVLIAVAILSVILMSLYSGISTSILVIGGAKNYTRAMLIAKTKMNEFRSQRLRGTDLNHEPVDEYPGFNYNRITERFEHPMLGPLPAKKTIITVTWQEKEKTRNYSITYVYPTR